MTSLLEITRSKYNDEYRDVYRVHFNFYTAQNSRAVNREIIEFLYTFTDPVSNSSQINFNIKTNTSMMYFNSSGFLNFLTFILSRDELNISNAQEIIDKIFIGKNYLIKPHSLHKYVEDLYSGFNNNNRNLVPSHNAPFPKNVHLIISKIMEKISLPQSLEYREEKKHSYSLDTIAAHEFNLIEKFSKIKNLTENRKIILNCLLSNSFAPKTLKIKRNGYTPLDMAIFGENEAFILEFLKVYADNTLEYMTKSKVDDYKIKESRVKLLVSSLFEKNYLNNFIPLANTQNKPKSKI